MTRTAVRRHVDVTDGRLVIRKIVVETSECRDVAPVAESACAPAPAHAQPARTAPRGLRPGRYAVRVRELHLL